MPIYMQASLSLNFTRVQPGLMLALHPAQVQGFGNVDGEATQADADAVAEAISGVYEGLPATQQAVLTQLLDQASRATD